MRDTHLHPLPVIHSLMLRIVLSQHRVTGNTFDLRVRDKQEVLRMGQAPHIHHLPHPVHRSIHPRILRVVPGHHRVPRLIPRVRGDQEVIRIETPRVIHLQPKHTFIPKCRMVQAIRLELRPHLGYPRLPQLLTTAVMTSIENVSVDHLTQNRLHALALITSLVIDRDDVIHHLLDTHHPLGIEDVDQQAMTFTRHLLNFVTSPLV